MCLTPQAAGASVATTTHPVVLDAAYHAAASSGQQEAVATTTAARTGKAPVPATYTVRPGDSLASIASHVYHNADAWTAIYWHNRKKIKWADEIYAGQTLIIPPKPARIPPAPSALAPAPPPLPAAPVSASQAPPQAQAPAPAQAVATYSGGGYPGGAFGACVVARESGGNAQVMNASGHYGLYQFSESTWVAYGGNPADFGHASVAEQNQVFANALAAGGQSNWAPYDGC